MADEVKVVAWCWFVAAMATFGYDHTPRIAFELTLREDYKTLDNSRTP
jgi:hypothetical protein